jgi:hypothetical protein
MFTIYTTNKDNDEAAYNEIEDLCGSIQPLPEGVQQLAKGVWFLESTHSLSFLATLGQNSLNRNLQFHVKGCLGK